MRIHRDPKLDAIRRLPLAQGWAPADIRAFAAIADELPLRAGRRLMTEGADGDEFVVILEGSAEVHRTGRHVATVRDGDFVGEIALLTGRPRTATVVATAPSLVLVVPRHRFLDLADRLPALRARVEEVVEFRAAV